MLFIVLAKIICYDYMTLNLQTHRLKANARSLFGGEIPGMMSAVMKLYEVCLFTTVTCNLAHSRLINGERSWKMKAVKIMAFWVEMFCSFLCYGLYVKACFFHIHYKGQ
jgi:hypothetical protein